ncbi:hypothetical protein QOZ80_7BG0589550 [Eleusine coracana subsp. coracana]|nr:hypothetical protein QOZ80_7BG0589550 [Eleusine coracana subsp. coracana]
MARAKRKAKSRPPAPPMMRPSAAAAHSEPPRPAASADSGESLDGGEVTMVRRSRVAPCITCGLCGGILRDATTVSECLHSFCRKCILQKLEDEDIKCCPTCTIDLGCAPLEKLRADHSLIGIRLMIFPAKRRKVEEILLPHPAWVSLPSPSHPVHEGDSSAKKTDAYILGEPMNIETEREAAEMLQMESTAYATKPIASSPHSAVAAGARPAPSALSDDRGNEQGDAQKECAQLAERGQSAGQLQGAIQGRRAEFDDFECKVHNLVTNQVTPQERSTPAEEVDLLIVTVEKENRTRAAAEFTVSSGVEIAMEKRATLSPVASENETHAVELENTATLERIEVYMGRSQALEAENARLREELEIEKVEKAAAFERTRIFEEERFERDSEAAQSTARMLEMIQDYRGRSHALGITNASLRKELDNEKANKAAYVERIRGLEEKLQTQSERLQTQSEVAQKAEAAQRQLVQDYLALESDTDARRLLFLEYQELKSDILVKSKEHETLLYDIDMLEKEKTCLEYQVDHLAKCLAQRTARIFERLDAYIGRKQDTETENLRLREQLGSEKAKHAAALKRARTLEETLRRKSEVAQRTEAALRQLLEDHHVLDLETSEESDVSRSSSVLASTTAAPEASKAQKPRVGERVRKPSVRVSGLDWK